MKHEIAIAAGCDTFDELVKRDAKYIVNPDDVLNYGTRSDKWNIDPTSAYYIDGANHENYDWRIVDLATGR
jgi:hypothetical protein